MADLHPKKPKLKLRTPPFSSDKPVLPNWLILRFHEPVSNQAHPSHICEALNDILPTHTQVAGVNYSCAGNIVLHAQAPSSAKLSAKHSKTIAKILPLYIGARPISFNIREHHVACHHVLVPEDKWESLDDEVNKEDKARRVACFTFAMVRKVGTHASGASNA
jgi:hypothetical protein